MGDGGVGWRAASEVHIRVLDAREAAVRCVRRGLWNGGGRRGSCEVALAGTWVVAAQ